MCGIVAYVGAREAYPVILKGLKRLEYRGYDSSGVALLDEGLSVHKRMGRVSALEDELTGRHLNARTGMGHTRWATHGEPSDRNAHPHLSRSGQLAMIHNGIIENYALLKQELVRKGHAFRSDTDAILEKVQSILSDTSAVQRIAAKYANVRDVLYLGRGLVYPWPSRGPSS